ncbi:hypothetical protein [Methylomonas sp. MgM2]
MATYQKNKQKIPRRLNPIEILRVRYWYEGVRIRLGYTQAKQLENHFRQTLDPNFLEKDPSGKWGRYKLGKNTPLAELIKNVDREVDGSAQEINHILWKVIHLNEKDIGRIDVWLNQLKGTEVGNIVFQPKLRCPGQWEPINKLSTPHYRTLVKVGNFDSLAALVLYWHKAKINGKGDQHALAYTIFEILLIIGYELNRRKLLNEFFELFKANIFEKMDWKNEAFTMTLEQYRDNVQILSKLASRINDRDYANSLDEHDLKAKLLTETHWLTVKLALGLTEFGFKHLSHNTNQPDLNTDVT